MKLILWGLRRKKQKGGKPINIFENVKNEISLKEAAEHYGVALGKNGMATCPFHLDCCPSLKLNSNFYYCFGCGASGDVIDFVAQLYDLSKPDAAEKLAADFGIISDTYPKTKAKPRLSVRQEEEQAYLRLLEHRRRLRTKLKSPPLLEQDLQLADLCRELEKTECMLDTLAVGDAMERLSVVSKLRSDGKVWSNFVPRGYSHEH